MGERVGGETVAEIVAMEWDGLRPDEVTRNLALDLLDERAEVERLRRLLVAVTWVQPMYNGSPSCSRCGNQKHRGHAEGCDLAALSSPTTGGTE